MHSAALLEALPVAVYTTDAEGRITFFNEAAATLWGNRPVLGVDRWSGAWRLLTPEGEVLPPDQSPMALTLREGRPVRGIAAVAERPDGTRVPFMPYPSPLRDEAGVLTGGINLLVDTSDRDDVARQSAHLAAIVASSDDAIVSKTLDGRITSWNAAATRIFGYQPEEIIGRPISTIIPPELLGEEQEIIASLRRGERVEHFDTVQLTKDGQRVNISVTISPLRDATGRIVGASKVARDITERKQSEQLQRVLFDELNHRVKNTLATIQAIASQSLRSAQSPSGFVTSFTGRLQALGRAHDLLVERKMKGADLMEIVREQVAIGSFDGSRIHSSGPPVTLDPRSAVQVGLVLHELATNARKYGALSTANGTLAIDWTLSGDGRLLDLSWEERGGPTLEGPVTRGFGTTLIQKTIESLGGTAALDFPPGGVICDIRLPLGTAEGGVSSLPVPANDRVSPQSAKFAVLHGKRVLIVEDEPLLAMDLESTLQDAGCVVVGPAANLQAAHRLIATETLDAALLDANLAGHPVGELAAALADKAVPFAFASGYGREALPGAYRDAPLLQKPIDADDLLALLTDLLRPSSDPGEADVLDARRTADRP